MRDNKVDVIISKERYEKLLRKESDLEIIRYKSTLRVHITYQDMRASYNTFHNDIDNIDFKYGIGENIPDNLKEFIENKLYKVENKIREYHEYRQNKLDGLKEHLKWEFKVYKKDPKAMPWFESFLRILKREQ